LCAGIDVRDCGDISWTYDVPATYWVTDDQASALNLHVDGWREGSFSLKHPFRVNSQGVLLHPDPFFPFVVDFDSNVSYMSVEEFDDDKELRMCHLQFRGGVYHILPRTPACAYSYRDNVLFTTHCMHDHVLRSGFDQLFCKSPRLYSADVTENGTRTVGRFFEFSIHGISEHYRFHRPYKKVAMISGEFSVLDN